MSRKRQEQRREQRRQQQQREAAAKKRALAHGKISVDLGGAAVSFAAAHAQMATNIDQMIKAMMMPPPTTGARGREPAPPPTFSECVIGYREWLVDAVGQLRAITMTKQIWRPGVNTARCRPHDQADDVFAMFGFPGSPQADAHPAPAAACHCGLYGWNDIRPPAMRCDDIDDRGRLWAFGAIAAWGDLQVHGDGFRASHACVVALAHTDKTVPRVRAVLERVAGEYRVPVVHADALQVEAERHGTPLPLNVRPQNRWTTPPLFAANAQLYVSPNTLRRLYGI